MDMGQKNHRENSKTGGSAVIVNGPPTEQVCHEQGRDTEEQGRDRKGEGLGAQAAGTLAGEDGCEGMQRRQATRMGPEEGQHGTTGRGGQQAVAGGVLGEVGEAQGREYGEGRQKAGGRHQENPTEGASQQVDEGAAGDGEGQHALF